jgi:hypothetical protein
MVGSGRCYCVVKEFSQGMRELRYELGASIRDNLVIESKSPIDMFKEKFGYPFRCDCLQARDNNYPLTKAMVYHNHDRVKTPRRRETSDKVHR